jgi:hypothetical protein
MVDGDSSSAFIAYFKRPKFLAHLTLALPLLAARAIFALIAADIAPPQRRDIAHLTLALPLLAARAIFALIAADIAPPQRRDFTYKRRAFRPPRRSDDNSGSFCTRCKDPSQCT